MNYRILELECRGTTYFIPQKRNPLSFWVDIPTNSSWAIGDNRRGFRTYNEAAEVIEADQPKLRTVKVHPYPQEE